MHTRARMGVLNGHSWAVLVYLVGIRCTLNYCVNLIVCARLCTPCRHFAHTPHVGTFSVGVCIGGPCSLWLHCGYFPGKRVPVVSVLFAQACNLHGYSVHVIRIFHDFSGTQQVHAGAPWWDAVGVLRVCVHWQVYSPYMHTFLWLYRVTHVLLRHLAKLFPSLVISMGTRILFVSNTSA